MSEPVQLEFSALTTRGDLLYRGASGDTRLAKGTAGQWLQQGANDPAWATLSIPIGPYVFINGDAGGYPVVDATPFYLSLGIGAILTADPTTVAPTAAALGYPTVTAPWTITRVDLGIVAAVTPGTAETGTGYIRVNNGTDNVIFNNTLQWNAAAQTYSATGLSIPLATGDFFSIKITPPTFATNPTNTYYVANVYGVASGS